ncbi:VOC family protein [Streptomyces sp. NBC_01353]|uniref:VOC family protein n=1 Tax=Streptomyces sp. NBC_01353 TaxID=2903835 RepID=UPI002E308313|nr:VOC family protein [Streptomyces sp. NBC_01353]
MAKAKCTAFWGHDGKALADFYAAALGWEITETYGETAAMISDGTTKYVFYTAESFKAPDWPADELVFHLDLTFDDVTAAERRLIGLGATKPAHQPGGKHWTVLRDPSGQPFCISAAG